jgi:hypothetical protein
MVVAHEVLSVWREVERLLEELPPDDPWVPTLRERAARLRADYQSLSATADRAHELITETQASIAASRAVLERVRARLPLS